MAINYQLVQNRVPLASTSGNQPVQYDMWSAFLAQRAQQQQLAQMQQMQAMQPGPLEQFGNSFLQGLAPVCLQLLLGGGMMWANRKFGDVDRIMDSVDNAVNRGAPMYAWNPGYVRLGNNFGPRLGNGSYYGGTFNDTWYRANAGLGIRYV